MKLRTLMSIAVALISSNFLIAQVAINTDASIPAPGSILHVSGSGNNDFYISDASGNVGIGTTSPTSHKFQVAGGDIGVDGNRSIVLGGNNANAPDATPDATKLRVPSRRKC